MPGQIQLGWGNSCAPDVAGSLPSQGRETQVPPLPATCPGVRWVWSEAAWYRFPPPQNVACTNKTVCFSEFARSDREHFAYALPAASLSGHHQSQQSRAEEREGDRTLPSAADLLLTAAAPLCCHGPGRAALASLRGPRMQKHSRSSSSQGASKIFRERTLLCPSFHNSQ